MHTVQSIRDIPPGAIRAQLQADGTVLVYMPGDTLPPDPPDTGAPLVPERVSMRQARLALLAAGKLASVSAAIEAIPDATQREAARITWEYSTEVQRHNGLVSQLGPALGMSAGQIDNLFIAAASL